MTKLVLSSTALALVMGVPAIAAAQSAPSTASCPPGSWFCAPTPEPHALQPLPADDEEPSPTPPPPPAHKYAPPPVVVYQPPAATELVRPEPAPPYEYAPRHLVNSVTPPHEWGLNFHVEGALLGHGNASNTGMGGGGLGLRFKPSRYFGIETDVDYVGGHDYLGDSREETAFSVNGLLFLNPRSHAQLYLLAGFGWSDAHVTSDGGPNPLDQHYNYFGGQFGGGLEIRASRVLAFDLDVRGFVRSRTDSLAQTQPEFTNPATGQTTNTSGGALVTGGMTLYF
jgi:hypothetical protein